MADSWQLVTVAAICVGWLVFAFISDSALKEVQRTHRIPALITLLQFTAGSIGSTVVLRILKLHPFQSLSLSQVTKILPVALCWVVGFLTTNYSFGRTALSFGHAVKSTEPLFLVAISLIFLGDRFSVGTYASMAAVALGVSMMAMTELSFDWSAFVSIAVSNIAFASRAVFAKRLQSLHIVDILNLFYYVSWISTVVMVPIALVAEGPQLLADMSWTDSFITDRLLTSAFCHFLYNSCSFLLLAQVTALTHSIANLVRRFILIALTMWLAGTQLTAVNLAGIALLFGGLTGYTITRMQSEKAKKP